MDAGLSTSSALGWGRMNGVDSVRCSALDTMATGVSSSGSAGGLRYWGPASYMAPYAPQAM